MPSLGGRIHACGQTVADGLDDGGQLIVSRGVLLGRVAELGVDDTVGREILDGFLRDAEQVFAFAHRGHRVVERGEVLDERARIRGVVEPFFEDLRVTRRNLVADLTEVVDDGLRTQATVEVVVECNLREALQQFQIHACQPRTFRRAWRFRLS